MKRTTINGVVLAMMLVLIGAACTNQKNQAAKTDRSNNDAQLTTYQNNQPSPKFNKSQVRQNLIDIETLQANSTVTTTFFFNQGVGDPIWSCPSVGMPIPTTWQLTSPANKYSGDSDALIPQIDPNGVYSGDSTGTYVICVDSTGKGYAFYWEGFVMAVTGTGKWDPTAHSVVLTGAPTAAIATKVG